MPPSPPPDPEPFTTPAAAPPPPPPGTPLGAAPATPLAYTPSTWPAGQVETSPDARQWGMFAHLSALVGFLIPFGNVIGPLVIWMMKKDQVPFVNDQGKEALNFQITVSLAVVAAVVVGVLSICIGGVGFFLLPAVGIAGAVMAAIGAMEANKGVAYRYPFALRLIK